MKPIDDDKKVKTIDKFIDDVNKTDKYMIKFGPMEFEMPKELYYRILEKHNLWEAEDISDVVNNYSIITTSVKMLDEKDKSLMRNAMRTYHPESLKELCQVVKAMYKLKAGIKEFKKFSRSADEKEGYSNNNIIILDNVYVGDYQFGQTKWFDYCSMIIKDKFNNTIPAMAFYKQNFIKQEETLEEELSVAMSFKDYSTAFDITFRAMPVKKGSKLVRLFNKAQDYVPKLSLVSITKSGGDKADVFPIDVKSFMPQYS